MKILELTYANEVADDVQSDLDYSFANLSAQEIIPGLVLAIKRYANQLGKELPNGSEVQILDEVVRMLDEE